MFELIIAILGIAAAAIYVGFLAFKIGAAPLWVIIILTFALVIREFAIEFLGLGGKKKPNGARQGR